MDQKSLFTRVQPRLHSYGQHNDLGLLCDFVDAVLPTVKHWANSTHPAKGERLIRLCHFLVAAGYDIPELAGMSPYPLYVSELFGYSIINLEEAGQLLGLTTPQSTHKAMRGEHEPVRVALDLADVKELYEERLIAAKQDLLLKLGRNPTQRQQQASQARAPSATPSAPAAATPPATPPVVSLPVDKDAGFMTLATLLSAALPLARHINSDRCTPADRSRFRDLMGDGGVFEISNILNALCSERARTEMKGRKP